MFRQLVRIAPPALLSILVLTACGGGGSSASPTAIPVPTPGQPAPPPEQPAAPALAITAQPATAMAVPAGSATLSVTATGGGALAYQWSRNGKPIEGATAASYTKSAVTAEDNNAVYRVAVKSANGEVLSQPALLSVSGPDARIVAGSFDPRFDSKEYSAAWWLGGLAFGLNNRAYVLNVQQDPGLVAIPGMPVTAVKPHFPCIPTYGMVADPEGTLYVACNAAVVKIGMDGVNTLLAGSLADDGSGYVDAVGPAARFGRLTAIAIAADGSVVVADGNNRALRRISANGSVRTEAKIEPDAAGTRGVGHVTALAFDAKGVLFIADGGAIYTLGAGNAPVTIAGERGEYGWADGTGRSARFRGIGGMDFDSKGNLFISDPGNRAIRTMTPDGKVITFAGRPATAGSADGKAGAATFNAPSALAIDASDLVYVVDAGDTLRTVTADATVSTVLGVPKVARSAGWIDGLGQEARFDRPRDLGSDAAGNLFIADLNTHAIRKVTLAGVVSTVASGGPWPADGAALYNPRRVAAAPDGSIYFAGARGIFKISVDGTINKLSAAPAIEFSYEGSGGLDLAVDANNNLYTTLLQSITADCHTRDCPVERRYSVQKTTPGGVVTEWRATGTGTADIFVPGQLVPDRAGNMLVADEGSGAIWVLSAAGGWSPWSGAKVAPTGRFDIDAAGNLYMLKTDAGGTAIVKISPQGARSVVAGAGAGTAGNGLLAPYDSVVALKVASDGLLYAIQGDAVVKVALP